MLDVIAGTVEVASGSDEFAPLPDGSSLEEGDIVRTGPDGRAQIRWFEGSITRLDTSTTVTLTTTRSRGDTTLIKTTQASGNSYHRVAHLTESGSRFDVTTPTASAAVQGTEYALFVAADGSTVIAVIDASVTVEALGGEIALAAGFSLAVTAAEDSFADLAPEPIRDDLLESEWLIFNSPGDVAFGDRIPNTFGLVFDSAGTLFVASEVEGPQQGGVYRVDPGGTTELFVSGLNGAAALAFDSTGALFVSDDPDRIHIVDASGAPRIFLDTADFGENPNAIAFDANDNLYVLFAGGSLAVFDHSGRVVESRLIDGIPTPQALTFDPANETMYAMDQSGVIWAIDTTTRSVTQYADLMLTDAEGGLAIGPDGSLYAAGYAEGTILRIDEATLEVGECLHGIGTPRGIAFDTLGRLYVSSYEVGQVLRFDGCA